MCVCVCVELYAAMSVVDYSLMRFLVMLLQRNVLNSDVRSGVLAVDAAIQRQPFDAEMME